MDSQEVLWVRVMIVFFSCYTFFGVPDIGLISETYMDSQEVLWVRVMIVFFSCYTFFGVPAWLKVN